MDTLISVLSGYLSGFYFPQINLKDVIEIIIITFMIYNVILFIKNTRAWTLFKGIVILLVFTLVAYICQLNTLYWIAKNTIGLGFTAIVIVFQPELRKALEQLGRKNINSIFNIDESRGHSDKMSDRTVNEIAKAAFEMGKVKTGALIVVERDILLTEYERTGIEVDAVVSSQLLINIFEHNTPLHDGAVIIRNNRVVAATCYLPLSDNMMLSKDLGTRHRAGVGVSEVTDSLTIICSEETGSVSVAAGGELERNVTIEQLKQRLGDRKKQPEEAKRFRIWKGRHKYEKDIDK